MTRLRVGDDFFNVVVEGQENKPALLLSHSLGANLHMWDAQVPVLTHHFRVIRYDSRGHGRSDAPRGPYSIWRLGRDALGVLDALGIEKAHVLGLSMGGFVGLWLLANARDRIGRAVLANTAASMPPPDTWNTRIRMARENGMAAIAPMVANLLFPKTFQDSSPAKVDRVRAMLAATPAHGYAACCAAIRDMDQRETIRSITNPVLVIAGRQDQSTPPDRGRLVADSIPGAQFLVLDAGHLSNIEAEDAFNCAAVEFLTTPEKVAKPVKKPPVAAKPVEKPAAEPKAKSSAKKATKKKAAKKPRKPKAPARKTAKKSAKKAARKKPTKSASRTSARKPARKPAHKPAAKAKARSRAAAKKR